MTKRQRMAFNCRRLQKAMDWWSQTNNRRKQQQSFVGSKQHDTHISAAASHSKQTLEIIPT